MDETITLYHESSARKAGRACSAQPVTTACQCAGCLYQRQRGQRNPANVQPATHRCERCDESYCADHLRYHARVELFLCARCFTIADRARRPKEQY